MIPNWQLPSDCLGLQSHRQPEFLLQSVWPGEPGARRAPEPQSCSESRKKQSSVWVEGFAERGISNGFGLSMTS